MACSGTRCARSLLAALANAVPQANVTPYKAALHHTSMRRSHLLRNRSNPKHLSQHMPAEAFRATFRSPTRPHLPLVLFDSQGSLARLLFAGIAKGVLPPIGLPVGPCQMPQELRTMGYPRGCAIGVSLLSALLWGSIDPPTPEESLLWGS